MRNGLPSDGSRSFSTAWLSIILPSYFFFFLYDGHPVAMSTDILYTRNSRMAENDREAMGKIFKTR